MSRVVRYFCFAILLGYLPACVKSWTKFWELNTNTITTSCAPALQLGSVLSVYTNATKWNDYVKNDGVTRYTGSNTACAGTETGGYNACIHGGEARVVTIVNRTSCSGLFASDALSAFNWRCDETGGSVKFYSGGLAEGRYLSDLIDFNAGAWKTNSVSVTDCAGTSKTVASQWHTNPIVKDPTGGSPVNLATISAIYIITFDPLLRFTIGADKIGFVIKPGVTMRGNAATNTVLAGNTRKFTWFEGVVDGTGNAIGLDLTNGAFAVCRGFYVQNTNSGTPNSITGGNLAPALIYDSGVFNSGDKGLVLTSSKYITIANFRATNTQNEAMIFDASDSVVLRIAGGSSGNDIIVTGNAGTYRSNAFLFSTLANGSAPTTALNITSTALENTVMGVATHNAANAGIEFGTSSRVSLISNAVVNNPGNGYALNGTSNNFFSGKLIVGNNVPDCSVTGGTLPGLVNATCAVNGSSNHTIASGASVANSYVGKLTSSDTANTSVQVGDGTTILGNITDWARFANQFRYYGLDGGAFPVVGNQGRCISGNCRIWDWSLRANDTILRAVLAIPTGNDYAVHLWNVAGQAECNTIRGALWQDQVCSFPGCFSSGACTGAGGVWSTALCTSKILRHTYEVFNDGYGNDNGLCETNEVCIYTPNVGAYQGHGSLVSAGSFTDGVLTGITLLKYETNGY